MKFGTDFQVFYPKILGRKNGIESLIYIDYFKLIKYSLRIKHLYFIQNIFFSYYPQKNIKFFIFKKNKKIKFGAIESI